MIAARMVVHGKQVADWPRGARRFVSSQEQTGFATFQASGGLIRPIFIGEQASVAGMKGKTIMAHVKIVQAKSGRRLARPVRDFVTGLLLFCALAGPGVVQPTMSGAWIATSAQAHIHVSDQMISVSGLLSGPIVTSPHGVMTLMSLALAFASLFSLNLWLVRHVRKVYATYRR